MMNCRMRITDCGMWISLLLLGFFALVLTACGSGEVEAAAGEDTPTIHPYFAPDADILSRTPEPDVSETEVVSPTISSLFAFMPTRTRVPLPTQRATSTPTMTPLPTLTLEPTIEGEEETAVSAGSEAVQPTAISALPDDGRFQEILIYDDELDPNWSLGESWDISYELNETAVVYSGDNAISVTPAEEFGGVFFTINEETLQEYLYEEILGVSLWLNSGNDYLPLDEMAVAIVGSNEFPYWVEDDNSVDLGDGDDFFSETRLYYLGLNQELPPNQWVEVILWLDELPYDPDYTFITGLYIKNGDQFTGTYYVDRVVLLTGDGS